MRENECVLLSSVCSVCSLDEVVLMKEGRLEKRTESRMCEMC